MPHGAIRALNSIAAAAMPALRQHHRGGGDAGALPPAQPPQHSAPRSRCTYGEANEDSHCQIVLCSTVDFCNFLYAFLSPC